MVECHDFEDTECQLLFAEIGDKNEKEVWVPIEKEKFEIRRSDESCTHFIADVKLETGYNYQFKARINKKDGEKREFISEMFEFSGKSTFFK